MDNDLEDQNTGGLNPPKNPITKNANQINQSDISKEYKTGGIPAVVGLGLNKVGNKVGGIVDNAAQSVKNDTMTVANAADKAVFGDKGARGYGLIPDFNKPAPAAEPINAGLNKPVASAVTTANTQTGINQNVSGQYLNKDIATKMDKYTGQQTEQTAAIKQPVSAAATESPAPKAVQQNKNGEYVVDYGGGNTVSMKDQAKAQQMQDKFNSSGKSANTYGDNLQTVEAGGIGALSPTSGSANASLYQDITDRDGKVIGRLSNTPLQAAISARDKAVADNKFNPPEGLTRTGNSTGTIATSSFGGNDGNIQRLNDSVDQQVAKAGADRIKTENDKIPLSDRAAKQAAEKDPMGFLKLKQDDQNQKTGFENAYAETKAKALNGDPEAIKNLSQFNSALNPREPKEEKPAFSDETIAMYPEYAAALRNTPASAMKKLRTDYANAIGDPEAMDKVLSNGSMQSRYPKEMLQQLLQS